MTVPLRDVAEGGYKPASSAQGERVGPYGSQQASKCTCQLLEPPVPPETSARDAENSLIRPHRRTLAQASRTEGNTLVYDKAFVPTTLSCLAQKKFEANYCSGIVMCEFTILSTYLFKVCLLSLRGNKLKSQTHCYRQACCALHVMLWLQFRQQRRTRRNWPSSFQLWQCFLLVVIRSSSARDQRMERGSSGWPFRSLPVMPPLLPCLPSASRHIMRREFAPLYSRLASCAGWRNYCDPVYPSL